MGTSAKLTSIEALAEFRHALVTFAEQGNGALVALELELRRTVQWLEHEQPYYWKRELLRREEELAQARSALAQRKLYGVSDPHRTADTVEQEKAFKQAGRRLEEARAKLEQLKRSARMVQRAVDEYRGFAGRLASLIEGDPPESVGVLDRMLAALAGYVSASPPPKKPSYDAGGGEA